MHAKGAPDHERTTENELLCSSAARSWFVCYDDLPDGIALDRAVGFTYNADLDVIETGGRYLSDQEVP